MSGSQHAQLSTEPQSQSRTEDASSKTAGEDLAVPYYLQRTAGNQAVGKAANRLPAPSAAASVPAQIKGMQVAFHDRMREANAIINATKAHYDNVNSIYAENFNIHRVVVGQAKAESVRNDKMVAEILSIVGTVAKLNPEGAAATAIVNIAKFAVKVQNIAKKAGKVATIAEKVFGSEKGKAVAGSEPMTPTELALIGSEHVISMMTQVNDVRDSADAVLDTAVDLSTQIGMDAPDSGQLDSEQAAALAETAAACEQMMAAIEPVLAALKELNDRRKVPMPSWREIEQDIWIAYFSNTGSIGGGLVRNHVREIGLFKRLGIVEITGMGMVWDQVQIAEGEDETRMQSMPRRQIIGMDAIEAAARSLPAKYRRLLLLTN